MAPLSTLVTLGAFAATASAFVTSPSRLHLGTLATPAGALSSNSNVRSRRRPAAAAVPTSLHASATTYELDEKTIRGPLTPVEDTIMVKVDLPKEVTSGGLFLPKMKNAKITRGTVTAVGEGEN